MPWKIYGGTVRHPTPFPLPITTSLTRQCKHKKTKMLVNLPPNSSRNGVHMSSSQRKAKSPHHLHPRPRYQLQETTPTIMHHTPTERQHHTPPSLLFLFTQVYQTQHPYRLLHLHREQREQKREREQQVHDLSRQRRTIDLVFLMLFGRTLIGKKERKGKKKYASSWTCLWLWFSLSSTLCMSPYWSIPHIHVE